MNRLIAGYKRFRETGWPQQRRAFEKLAERGQKPKALVLACVDSRVDPAMIFDTAPGEVLTVRNVANLVPPYAPDAAYHGTSAALEFGVRALEVPHLIVLGHGLCGGVKALIEGAPTNVQEFVGPWMSIAHQAREHAMLETDPVTRQRICEHEVVKVSLVNLMSFPWIAKRVAEGSLQLHGAWFNIHTGTLLTLRPDGTFGPPE
ncbi:MAG: carbonic anhydrase [Bryobacteraceae bacterium]